MSDRRFALLIGNGTFDCGLPQLKAPKHDLEGMARVLRDPQIGDFVGVSALPMLPLYCPSEASAGASGWASCPGQANR